jgi:hypothetical protein
MDPVTERDRTCCDESPRAACSHRLACSAESVPPRKKNLTARDRYRTIQVRKQLDAPLIHRTDRKPQVCAGSMHDAQSMQDPPAQHYPKCSAAASRRFPLEIMHDAPARCTLFLSKTFDMISQTLSKGCSSQGEALSMAHNPRGPTVSTQDPTMPRSLQIAAGL